jgi:sulfur carrier protein
MTQNEVIVVQINEKSVEVKKGSTITDVVNHLGLNPKNIAIEVDGKIIPKSKHDSFVIENKSIIEVISFVGGG